MSRSVVLAAGLALSCLVLTAQAGDWPWWRGPNFNGIAEDGQTPPTEWSGTKNVIWKTKIPGRGHSSPTVVGDKVFLASADERQQKQAVLAFDRATGKQLWLTEISQGGFPKTHEKNTHATSTVACDGEKLFINFHHNDLITLAALDLDGNKLWSKDIGTYAPRLYEYGYAPSPLIYKDTVIISAEYEKGGFIKAFDRSSGNELWKLTRPLTLSFSSPVIANVAGRDQLFISGGNLVSSYDPSNGQQIWSVQGTTMATCGTMVWDGDSVFASGGYPDPQTIAVKADGSRQVLWTNNTKCYEQSMLAKDGYVYAVSDQGIAFCWRGTDGKEMWKSRLQGPVSSSPILVGDTIYSTVENGTTFVFKANPEKFEAIARNKLGDEGFATMAVCDGQIFLRTATGSGPQRTETLYCIGNK